MSRGVPLLLLDNLDGADLRVLNDVQELDIEFAIGHRNWKTLYKGRVFSDLRIDVKVIQHKLALRRDVEDTQVVAESRSRFRRSVD